MTTSLYFRIVSLSLPVYLAETIHPEVRGTLGMLPATLGNSGVMLVYILGFWLDWSQLSLAGAVGTF
jgi:facilitated trehalose transporter